MSEVNYVKLLSKYSREKHLKSFLANFSKIDFKINPIINTNWNDPIWMENNQMPYIALTHLIDSYYCLPERPDMAFTYIWKAINNSYVKFAKNTKITKILHNAANNIDLSNREYRELNTLTDSEGIIIFKESIFNHRNDIIKDGISIMNLLKNYISLIPLKTLRFISNIILKGYVVDNQQFPTLTNNSSYFTIKKNYLDLYDAIVNTYGISYKNISNPVLNGIKIKIGIVDTDENKSRAIIHSLSLKIKELLTNQETVFSNSDSTINITINLSDEELIDFMLRVVLYTIRNNSVHGNVVERLNSDYANKDSLKASIYVYFLAHYFLSLGLYINNEINLSDLAPNIDNLNELNRIM
ncbi:MAG: hypothetical protein ACEPOZ_22430 [Marinifilaceae bacterium]